MLTDLLNQLFRDDGFCRTATSLLKTSQKSQNAAERTSHRLSRCQNVPTKIPFYIFFSLTIYVFLVLSYFEFLSFATIWFLSYWVFFFIFSFPCRFLSNLDFCQNWTFVTVWVLWQLEFCHNLSFFNCLSFLVLSHFDFS